MQGEQGNVSFSGGGEGKGAARRARGVTSSLVGWRRGGQARLSCPTAAPGPPTSRSTACRRRSPAGAHGGAERDAGEQRPWVGVITNHLKQVRTWRSGCNLEPPCRCFGEGRHRDNGGRRAAKQPVLRCKAPAPAHACAHNGLARRPVLPPRQSGSCTCQGPRWCGPAGWRTRTRAAAPCR